MLLAKAKAPEPETVTAPLDATETLLLTSAPKPSLKETKSQSKVEFKSPATNVITKFALPPITLVATVIVSPAS